MSRALRRHGAEALWLLALAVFIFAGMPLATFHGDEAMQVYMSRDYWTAYVHGQPGTLMVNPPYYIDDDPWLRILNGSVNRYAIGLSWHLAGFTEAELPPRPGWDWGLTYDRNVETAHRPSDDRMLAARFSSTLFLALSALCMFALGWQFGARVPAMLVSGLYTLNPALLLNGRRAMMEGSLLFFGGLTILLAVLIARRRSESAGDSRWSGPVLWGGLALAAGLTLTSKHSGVVWVAGAWGWIALAEIARLMVGRVNWRGALSSLGATALMLTISGLVAAGLFIALSPALWNDAPARFGDLIEQRQGLLDIQVQADPLAPTTLAQRIEGMLTQPFIAAPMHFEVANWAEAAPINAEIARYMASPLSGLQAGPVLGALLTLLAGLGLLALIVPRWRAGAWTVGGITWPLVVVASLLVNPLPWQRYYLPLIPVMTLLAGVGLALLIGRFVQKPAQAWT